jgi:uncharacterized protein (DUF4415 family)
MKKAYSFEDGVRGKFFRPQKVQKTLRLDKDVLDFFQKMSVESGIPYQTRINMSLRKFSNEESELVISVPKKKTG